MTFRSGWRLACLFQGDCRRSVSTSDRRQPPHSGRPLIVAIATPSVLMNNFPAPDIAMEFSMLYYLHRFNIRT
jgi:hypothetical protein